MFAVFSRPEPFYLRPHALANWVTAPLCIRLCWNHSVQPSELRLPHLLDSGWFVLLLQSRTLYLRPVGVVPFTNHIHVKPLETPNAHNLEPSILKTRHTNFYFSGGV